MIRHMMLATTALTLVAGVAAAQSRVISAADRVAAENQENLGVRAGSFLVIPTVDVEGRYDDNIYATTNNTTHDFVTTVRPQVAVKSNWSRHALNAVARVERKTHARKSAEDETNYSVALDGRMDVLRETSIGGGVSFARDHEDRGTPTNLGTPTEPTKVDTATARIGAFRGLGRANLRGDISARNLDYKNGVTATNAVVNNNIRDRNEFTYSVRAGYEFTPEIEGFIRAALDTRSYDYKGGSASVNRSNHGQTYVAGVNFDLSGKTKAEVFAGTESRNYTASTLKDVTELTYGATVTHNLSQLTTLKGNISRSIEETTLGNSSGFIATSYSVGVEHALRRNILLHAKTGVEFNEYQGTAANQREDDLSFVSFGADYYMNRNLKAGLAYEFRNRDSNATGGDYDRNRIMLRLTGTF